MTTNKTCTAALDLFRRGFTPIPLRRGTKATAVKWDPWVEDLSEEKIRHHFNKYPNHELAVLLNDELLVLDADTPDAVSALHQLLKSYEITPTLSVNSARGCHVYLRRASGTYAKSDAPNKDANPAAIDIKTGRAITAFPPSTGKSIDVDEIERVSDLPEVDQVFIDAVYRHNGRDAPRPLSKQTPPATVLVPLSSSELEHKRTRIAELLAHIDPDTGYHDWLRIGIAIYVELEGAPVGFQLFDEWSAKGTKYPGTAALQDKWGKFGRYGGRRVTIATIAMLARDGGANLGALAREHNMRELLASDDLTAAVVSSSPEATQATAKNSPSVEHPLAAYSLRGGSQMMFNEMAVQVVLPGRVIVIGQLVIWYGPPNTGKTLIILWICITAIRDRTIKAKNLFYVNADDTYLGIAQKTALAEEFGFEILAPGHNGFEAAQLHSLLREIVKAGEASNTIVILDTLKKFADLMGKQGASAFGRIARVFVAAGGTLVGLAHTNKNRDDNGKLVYAGVSDFIDDSDCAYILDTVEEANDQRVVSFENLKSRGNVAQRAAFSYSIVEGLTHREILDSVSIVDQDELKNIEELTAKRAAHPKDLVDKIAELIQRGYDAKGQLVQQVAERTKYGQHRVRATIDAYTGEDPTKHRWICEKGAHGLQTYRMLPKEAPADANTSPDRDRVIHDGPRAMTDDPVDDADDPSEDLDVPY
ncbi:Primase C terminal 2 family protein [gamma proteobacterium NOR5-3]|nr:Primase C terminal 2 family protein [gamma proteobacterium NOR5-3]